MEATVSAIRISRLPNPLSLVIGHHRFTRPVLVIVLEFRGVSRTRMASFLLRQIILHHAVGGERGDERLSRFTGVAP